MGRLLGPEFPSDLGLAVSGGGDSMAMLYLAHNWTHHFGVRLWVATVDHGLRAESASEARLVAEECAVLGWPHATLRWHWDRHGNVQDAARRARGGLLDQWRGHVKHILFAHSQDDQAETVLMRLARGSGVDGLAGMRAARTVAPHPVAPGPLAATDIEGDLPDGPWAPGFQILRPCLGMTRDELRHFARVLKGRWVDDPSNDDPTYQRVRVRKLLALLRDEGVTASHLAETAHRMARARDGLTSHLVSAIDALCDDPFPGQVRIDRDGFARLDEETQLRMLTSALCYASASEYRPRARSSEALLSQVLSGRGGTLHGAEVSVGKTQLWITREWAAVQDVTAGLDALWDGQWRVQSQRPDPSTELTVRALGEDGWCQIADHSNIGLPHRAALALPSVWSETGLIWCPVLENDTAFCAARYVKGRPDAGFKAFCLSH
ncbi:tRNA lysidine(34) synthetase TilS [Marivita sp. S6314]|uniref:tRNA lysidine(34) synthetase TilS n=1 Tax=Marivita sp. S6314 TaxID=2926406 RepID=UPI001FF277A6|nr:tRNA lysidine(34) synthetase TilS [Marivita sp. S6314]MCK0151917.1 tRNA lysidine(34) synthetase TilS [Marivita sp. S6314]